MYPFADLIWVVDPSTDDSHLMMVHRPVRRPPWIWSAASVDLFHHFFNRKIIPKLVENLRPL
jgi:hypothetical protein